MQYPLINGVRLYLRGLDESDADGDYPMWFNDQETCKYNSHALYPYSRGDCLKYIQHVHTSNNLILAVILSDSEKHIGNVSLQGINHLYRTAEFAVIIGDKNSWGKGYAKEAASLIISHGFNQLNLNRIYCGTSADNIPMQKLATSLGMKEEGRRRQAMFKNGHHVDVIEYGLLKEEFEKCVFYSSQ